MRISTVAVIFTFIGVACTPVHALAPVVSPPASPHAEPSPYTEVVSGPVSALVPRNWRTVPAPSVDGIRGGFFASPRPHAWDRMDGSVEGMAATWVDATKVGVPSDYYYLAATGPLLDRLTGGRTCRALHQRVFANHRPGLDGSRGPSPGDYVASADGRCDSTGTGTRTRWAAFVAAPGFGPAGEVGIPGSGLYVVVAVLRASAGVGSQLDHLVRHTAFGGTTVPQLVAAATGRIPGPS